MSYQEKVVGNSDLHRLRAGLLLVYLVLAGQYESWIAPLVGHRCGAAGAARPGGGALGAAARLDNNLYTQIGLILLIALSARTPS